MNNIHIMIFKNDRKTKDNQPDYNASAKLGDKFFDCGAGWTKTSAKGTKFISLSLGIEDIKNIINAVNTTSEGQPIPFANKDEEWL